MTNEELDNRTIDEAYRIVTADRSKSLLGEVARLAREGWTPFVAVDPDIAEAEKVWEEWGHRGGIYLSLMAIKRGRALAAEAKPGMVWVKHNWSEECPVYKGAWVWIKEQRVTLILQAQYVNWRTVTHYAIITPPEDK